MVPQVRHPINLLDNQTQDCIYSLLAVLGYLVLEEATGYSKLLRCSPILLVVLR